MDTQYTHQLLTERLLAFYQERTSMLQKVELNTIIRADKQLPFLFQEENASTIVRKLLDNYLQSNQGWWQDFFASPQFMFDASLLRDSHKEWRMKYEFELGCAETRLVRNFVRDYCSPDYSIDWSKIFRLLQTQ